MPETVDIFAHKGIDGDVTGIGRFRAYIKDGKFNKAFYLDPDNIELA
jgi:hypothetical protein